MTATTYQRSIHALCLLVAATVSLPAAAQSNVDPDHKFAWSENAGWTNWGDATGGDNAVDVESDHLVGLIWSEQLGWINVGNGGPYQNTNGTNFGVNIQDNGDLGGYAWAENVGWINFSTPNLGAQRARFDAVEQRFFGYAWGENCGWLNLDDEDHFVSVQTVFLRGDCNEDGVRNIADPVRLLGILFSGLSPAECQDACDANDDGLLNIADPVRHLNQLFAGGPELPAPFVGCGPDPTSDSLSCVQYTTCP